MKSSERDFVQDAVATKFELELDPPQLPPQVVARAADLDLSGLPVPLVILRLNRALRDLDSGTVIRLRCDTQGIGEDLQIFSRVTGNPVKAESDSGVFSVQRK